MVLFRALGWLLLALAVGAIVHDGLAWWSDGALHLLPLGELWSRLDFGSLQRVQAAIQRHLSSALWVWFLAPLLKTPALPAFTILGVFFLWLGRRIGSRSELGLVGTRSPRRRRRGGGLSQL